MRKMIKSICNTVKALFPASPKSLSTASAPNRAHICSLQAENTTACCSTMLSFRSEISKVGRKKRGKYWEGRAFTYS